jgi:hypothetical protein
LTETTVGREPVQIVEIEQPRCTNTYSVLPCTALLAAGLECMNTRKTCQDTPNYDGSKLLTWRFINKNANRPIETYEASSGNFKSNPIPSLIAAKTNPTEINLGGSGTNSTAFGMRAVLNCSFLDHPDSDSFSDPYIVNRNYIATDQGTFWTKWLARNPFYINYIIRVYDGYHGQTLAQMRVREYLIDKITNPNSSGVVNITAKDPLKLADGRNSLFPKASEITLKNAIGVSGTITVLGTSADLNEQMFTTTHRAGIGDELLTYTSITQVILDVEYTLNGVSRGVGGTDAETHDAGDTFQKVVFWDAAIHGIVDILEDLLGTGGAGIDVAYLPIADWLAEFTAFGSEFNAMSAYVTEPTSVSKLVSELADHLGFVIWWDDRATEIKLQLLRPPEETPTLLTDNNNFIANSVSLSDDPKRRISRVYLSFNPFDQTEIGKQKNFANTHIQIDAISELPELYGEIRNKVMLSRWLTSTLQASSTTGKLINLLSITPKLITFSLDAKDRAIWTGDVVDINHRKLVDENGLNSTQRFFIISANEIKSGEVVQYKAITYSFVGRFLRWMADDAPVFTSATDSEKESGGWWSDASGLMSDSSEGYKWQ